MKVVKFILYSLLGLSLVSGLLSWYLYAKDYGSYFHERKGTLARVEVEPVGGDSLLEKSWLTLHNSDGFKVDYGMLVPRQKGRKYPVVVLMGGKATGKYAVDYAIGIENVIIVAPDYAYEPREKYTLFQFLSDVPEIRTALVDVIPSVMLVTDYLWQRDDVDTTKLVLLGYSFGAPGVPPVIANDRRAAVAAIVYGGGDLHSLIRHNVRRYESELVSEFVGSLSGLLLRPLEPLRYIEAVSPTPLIMINGTHDEQVPRTNTEMLFERAREPKKQIWLDSKHVHPRNIELTKLIVKTLSEELRSLNILPQ
ncbi:MAG: hypothetical protein HY708_06290 [Ignavibacteriae bacterium]|nr:hypothetical protein [Ignavibacteriota bacterium]